MVQLGGGARGRSGHRPAKAALSCNNESHRPIGWLPNRKLDFKQILSPTPLEI